MEAVKEEKMKKDTEGKEQPIQYTREQLVDMLNQAGQQIQELRQRLMQIMQEQAVLRMNFLMDVIVNKDSFPSDYVEMAVEEFTTQLFHIDNEEEVAEKNK